MNSEIKAARPQAAWACCRCGGVVPFDEVVVPEAVPYVIHFCGLDCYAAWRRSAEQAEGLQPR
jgi:hypothetical protein